VKHGNAFYHHYQIINRLGLRYQLCGDPNDLLDAMKYAELALKDCVDSDPFLFSTATSYRTWSLEAGGAL
jgi:hypothetical protein